MSNEIPDSVKDSLRSIGLFPHGIIKSPLLGKGGSLEFFIYLKIDNECQDFDYKNEVNNLL